MAEMHYSLSPTWRQTIMHLSHLWIVDTFRLYATPTCRCSLTDGAAAHRVNSSKDVTQAHRHLKAARSVGFSTSDLIDASTCSTARVGVFIK